MSAATLLRMVRGSLRPEHACVRVLGVDDWAWRRGCRYGTILCDLERRCVVDLLADRSADSLATWLERHPGVEIVSRNRGGGYAEGARRGARQAVQIADRWHLFANCSAALLDVVKRLRPTITAAREETGATNVSPSSGRPPMTAAEQRSFLVWQRRMGQCTEARQLPADGIGIIAQGRVLGDEIAHWHQAWSRSYVCRKHSVRDDGPSILIRNGLKLVGVLPTLNRRRIERYAGSAAGAWATLRNRSALEHERLQPSSMDQRPTNAV